MFLHVINNGRWLCSVVPMVLPAVSISLCSIIPCFCHKRPCRNPFSTSSSIIYWCLVEFNQKMSMKEKRVMMCVFVEGIYCSPPRTASPHLECLWNIYRSHWHWNSPQSTLWFKIEGSLSENDCVFFSLTILNFLLKDLFSPDFYPPRGLSLYPVESSFMITSESPQHRYRHSCYHGVWLSASQPWQFLTTRSKGHDRSSRQLFGEINASLRGHK